MTIKHRPAPMLFDMKPLKFIIMLCVTSCLAVLSGDAYTSETYDEAFNLTEISQGVYVHQGRHVALDHADNDDIANIGFIIGDKCIAVIDTGGSVAIGRALKQAIRRISSLPVCYVINTHIHYDHVLGNVAFRDERPEFVGHENLELEMEYNRSFFLSEFAANLGEAATDDWIIGPELLVSDQLELELGNRPLTLIAYPPAHSHTDLSVYDHKTGTIWLSDLLFIDRIPVLDGSLKGWIKTMQTLTAQHAQHVIPGHGPVTLPWPSAANAQARYLDMLSGQIREEINKGTFMEDVIETVGKQEKTEWLLHEQSHKRNVSKAFTELEWE